MSGFAALGAELDAWGEAGLEATLWWRDDDAKAMTPALARLLALRNTHGVPLCLAIIPDAIALTAGRALAGEIVPLPHIDVAQHGFAHRNHAAADQKKSEYPATRDSAAALDELGRGRRLMARFGPRLAPVLVPPWNRIAADLLPALPNLGFTAISTYGLSGGPFTAPGLKFVNTHLDPLGWRQGGGFLGAEEALAPLLTHLAARRHDPDMRSQTSGLLTHHLVMDEAAFAFTDHFLGATTAHPAVRWVSIAEGLAQARAPTAS